MTQINKENDWDSTWDDITLVATKDEMVEQARIYDKQIAHDRCLQAHRDLKSRATPNGDRWGVSRYLAFMAGVLLALCAYSIKLRMDVVTMTMDQDSIAQASK